MPTAADQAASLRNARPRRLVGKKSLVCIAIASGKGGVGKTFVAVNLATALARLNHRVLLVDGDLGLANADIVLGVNPEYTLQDAFFLGRDIADVVTRTPYGVDLLAASSGSAEMVNMGGARVNSFVEGLIRFAAEYDVLLFDCASGIHASVMAFVGAAPRTIVVTTPQPTALMDAYALIKTIHQSDLAKDLSVVVNMAETDAQGEAVMRTLSQVVNNHLSMNLDLLGIIPATDLVPQAVRARQPVLAHAPESAPSRRVLEVAKRVIQKQQGRTRLDQLDAKGLVNGLLSVREK